MNLNMELMEYIYQDAEMACFTLTTTLDKLNGKDNKIKSIIEDILKGYERYLEETKEELEEHGISLKPLGAMSKMGASMGVKKEVKCDNSDSSIADMLIKGISMGSLDMEKKINEYQGKAEKKYLKKAKEFFEFQHDSVDKLKEYL